MGDRSLAAIVLAAGEGTRMRSSRPKPLHRLAGRTMLQYMLDHEWYTWFAKIIAVGEVLIGIGLLVGALTGIAAFFGATLNMSFLLAGTISSNPILFFVAIFIILGWRVAGWIGVDRFLLPLLGAPWTGGHMTTEPPKVTPTTASLQR